MDNEQSNLKAKNPEATHNDGGLATTILGPSKVHVRTGGWRELRSGSTT